jgi:WD40 repeat protein
MRCFDDGSLEGFLAGRAPRGFERALDDHLRACRACRDRLDRLCADPILAHLGCGGPSADRADGGTDVRPDPVVRSWSGPLKAEFLVDAVPDGGESGDADAADIQLPAVPGLEIRRRIGAGGMGIVFEAFDPSLKRRVAVKMLRGFRRSPESLRRLRQEAETAARVNHPGFVQIHGLTEADGQACLVLELVDGPSLAERLDGKPQAPRDASLLALSLAEALAVAHRQQIVHRDLKPSNILLASPGRPAREATLSMLVPKIADFGLAKVLDDDTGITRDGQLIGTPAYAAPEQLSRGGTGVGPAADVYSLGAVLYTMLTGLPPLQSDDTWRTVRMVLEDDPVAPRRLQPGVPADLDTICLRCLAKDPARRYPDAGELAADLRRFLGGTPILARPAGPLERAWRWGRRNPALAASVTALTLSVVLATTGATIAAVHYRALEREHDRQRVAAERALADSRRALAESFRTIGLRLQSDNQGHLAPICFAEAVRQLPPGDPLRRDNEIRAAAALRPCPRPVALLGDPASPAVGDVRFHPSGRWLMALPLDRSTAPTVWEIARGSDLRLPAPLGPVTALAWDGTGERLVVGTGDGRVRIVRFPDLRILGEFAADGAVRSVAVSVDGKGVAAASAGGMTLWRVGSATADGEGAPTSGRRWFPAAGIEDRSDEVSFSPDGRHLVTTTLDRRLFVHAVDAPGTDPVLVASCGIDATGLPLRPQFDRKGRLVVWSEGTLQWYDLDRGRSIRSETVPAARFCEVNPWTGDVVVGGENRFVRFGDFGRDGFGVDTRSSGCWLADGGLLTGGPESDTLIRWTPDFSHGNGWPLFQPDGVMRMRLSDDGKLLATVSAANRLRVWSMPEEHAPLTRIDVGPGVSWVSVSPDATSLLLRSDHSGTRVVPLPPDASGGVRIAATDDVVDAAWCGDGHDVVTLAAIPGGARIERLDGTDGEPLGPSIVEAVVPARSFPDRHRGMAVSPDGTRVAFVSVEPADLVIAPIGGSGGVPIRVGIPARFLLGGPRADRIVVVAGDAGEHPDTIVIVDWDSGRIVHRHDVPAIVEAVSTPDGGSIAMSERGNGLRLLDAASGIQTVLHLPHPNRVVPEALSSDGRLLLTRGDDRNLRLWDWRTGTLVMPPASFPKSAAATFVADDRAIVLVRHDGFCHILGTSDGQPLCTPLRAEPGEPLGEIRRTNFSTGDARGIIAIGGEGGVRVVGLGTLLDTPARDADRLVALCRLVTCHHLVEGRPTPVDPGTWDAQWRELTGALAPDRSIDRIISRTGGSESPPLRHHK